MIWGEALVLWMTLQSAASNEPSEQHDSSYSGALVVESSSGLNGRYETRV